MLSQPVDQLAVGTQLSAARAELEARIRGGRLGSADDLREAFPAVWEDADAALELVYAEYVLRRANGESADRGDWFRRYPEMSARLDRLFGLYDLMAGQDTAGGGQTGTVPGGGKRPPERAEHPDGYEILGEIGRGGMAVVYKARQVKLNRVVAVKVLRGGGWLRDEDTARIRREAEAVARLQHPHVVQIHEVGEWDGEPFLALEFVPGGTLADALARPHRLGTVGVPADTATGLVGTLARAMQHAHEQGIVHRDLKPANVLLADDPAGPFAHPKIADFGLAVAAELDSSVSQSAALVGTPCYMAPEQANSQPKAVGPGTDVYALGGILYELLTGRPPFQGATVLETLDLVRHTEPARPRLLRPQVPRDLETVCLKCLAKDPARRYPSAAALADDLARFRDGRPIQARPVGVGERALKWCRRRPLLAGLAAALAAAVLVAVVLPSVFWGQAEDGRKREAGLRKDAEEGKQREADLRHEAEEREARLLLKTARLQWIDSDLAGARELLARCDEDHRPAEWQYLWRATRPAVLELQGESEPALTTAATALAYTPDGTTVVAVLREKQVRSWDAATGRLLHSVAAPHLVKTLIALPSKEAVVGYNWFTPGRAGQPTVNLAVLDLTTGGLRPLWGIQHKPTTLVVSPDGETVAYRLKEWSLVVADVNTGRELWQRVGGDIAPNGLFVISADGRRIAVGKPDRSAEVFDLRTGKSVWTTAGPSGVEPLTPSLFAVPRDASRVVFRTHRSGQSNDLIVRDPDPNGKEVVIRTPIADFLQVQFSPDDRLLAASGREVGFVCVWDAHTGQEVITLRGHRDRIQCFAFSPDSKHLAVGCSSGRIALWDVTADNPPAGR